MKKRVLTGAIIFIAVILFFLSRLLTLYLFDIFIAICATIACVEISQVLNKANKPTNTAISCTMPIVYFIGTIIGILNERTFAYYIVYFISMFVFYFVFTFLITLLSRKSTKNEMELIFYKRSLSRYSLIKGLRTSLLFIYPSLFFASFFFINHFNEFTSIVTNYEGKTALFATFILIFVFVNTMLTDTFAMFSGMLFKGPKLCQKISPKKTISGAIGGVVCSLIGSLILFLIFDTNSDFTTIYTSVNFSAFSLVIFSIIASIISQCGDIFASLLKRKAGVKDYSNILPGHGGVMDRMDGICFNALFSFLVLFILFF